MKLHIAFSGGETSAYMTRWLLDNKVHEYDETLIVFANTGQESEKTLQFVHACSEWFGVPVRWVEAVVPSLKKGIGTRHREVDFRTASRAGEPYEAVIAKYGIPNQTWQICSRELKENTVRSFLRAQGWRRKDYVSAIGIRADEAHRISSNLVKNRLIYPLVEDNPVDKAFVKRFWKDQNFHLGLKEHEGNCMWCWKKSKRKLLTLAKDTPDIFDFPKRMEALYGLVGHEKEPRVFFRGRMSTEQLLAESRRPFEAFTDKFELDMDAPGGCSESCEPFK